MGSVFDNLPGEETILWNHAHGGNQRKQEEIAQGAFKQTSQTSVVSLK